MMLSFGQEKYSMGNGIKQRASISILSRNACPFQGPHALKNNVVHCRSTQLNLPEMASKWDDQHKTASEFAPKSVTCLTY